MKNNSYSSKNTIGKRNYFRFSLLLQFFLTFILACSTYPQLSEGGQPYSFTLQLKSSYNEISTPRIDKQALLKEDEFEQAKGVPFRFGFSREVNFSLQNSGTWETLPDGAKLWRLKVTCPGAVSTNLVYKDYFMPHGAKLFLYNDKQTEVIGAFTERNHSPDGTFSTGIVRGSSVTLEYYEPANVPVPGRIVISNIVHGYKNVFKEYPFWEKDLGTSGSCNINVNCTQGDNWQNEKRAVAMILTSGNSRVCSGAMINNARRDLMPYFLTANHCIVSGNPNTWIIMFRYESPDCSIIDGPLNYTLSGTTTKAANANSDFGLLLLNQSVPDSFKVHYLGWNANDAAASSGACIHHPDGDIKKISISVTPNTRGTWSDTPENSHWNVVWSEGVTEPGSSGAPLFDQDHRVIGQLHGGPSACSSEDKSDMFGMFSMSWNYGTTPSTRLKDWLDPDSTGTLTLNGWDPSIGDADTVPPTQVTDLHTSAKASSSITLAWTVPTDTSYGGIMAYDVRYSLTPITDAASFNNAAKVPFIGLPKPAGQLETLRVDGLEFQTAYYFALRSSDFWKNVSKVSNIFQDTALAAPKIDVTPRAVTDSLIPNQVKKDTILLKNVTLAPSTLNYSITFENNTFPAKPLVQIVPLQEKANIKQANKNDKSNGISSGQAVYGSGGPDAFGYKWIDSDDPNGPLYVWNDIASTGTAVTSWIPSGSFDGADEGYAGPFPFGFNFKFYGQSKQQVYISSNGLLVFTAPITNLYTNSVIPEIAKPNEFIAPFWDDLDCSSQGAVYYKQDGNKFIVQYSNVKNFSGSSSLTFQIVLYSDGKIMFYYNYMEGTLTSGTTGIENADGNIGLQIAYNADYIKNNLAVKIASAPDWLAGTNLSGQLNSNQSAAIVLSIESKDFAQGTYSMDMKIASNDPLNPFVAVPVKMILTDSIPDKANTWESSLTLKDAGNLSRTLIFGMTSSATDGIDTSLGELSLPPLPPTGTLDVRFEMPIVPLEYSIKDYRKDTLQSAEWNIKFQTGAGGYPVTFAWNPSALPSGTFTLKDIVTGTIVNVDMKAQDSVRITNPGITAVKIDYAKQLCRAVALVAGWNLAAIPLLPANAAAIAVFPAATSQMFTFNNGYTSQTTLTAGKGYWVRYSSAANIPICGTSSSGDIALSAGWNLVGAYNSTIPVSSISTTPAGIINSSYFGFSNGYVQAANLEPGKGCWIRTSQAGTLNLPVGVVAKSGAEAVWQIDKSWSKIIVTDKTGNSATLYAAKNGVNTSTLDLPPVPPAGIFDVRFASQSLVENLGSEAKAISISGATYPVEIRAEGIDLSVKDKATGKLLNSVVKSGSSIVIANENINSIEVSANIKPVAFELQQNYPNPFNPSTMIRFGLPENARVRLTIYNQIGEQVAELVNGQMEAGYHQVTWNAANMSSGVYFYEIRADKFRAVKKLIFMK